MNTIKNFMALNFSEKTLSRCALFIGLYTTFLLFVTIFYWGTTYSDDMEHLHASWLVWSGKLPYRDFFEHHHPLLWFLFAPMTGLFYDKAFILYVAGITSLIASMATWFYIYKVLTQFIADTKVWIFTLSFLMFFSVYDQGFMIEFRPDIYMYLCFWSGLYYYFSYIKTADGRKLSIAAILFTFSFLFLQKILLLLLVLCGFSLYLIKNKKMKWLDVGKALVIPFLLMSGFALFLILTGSFENYWKLNLELNTLMAKHYGLSLEFYHSYIGTFLFTINNNYAAVNFSFFSKLITILALMALPFFFKEDSAYRKCLGILFVSEIFIRLLTFSSYFVYFYLLHILAFIIIITTALSWKSKIVNMLFSLITFIYLLCVPSNILSLSALIATKNNFIKELQYIIDNTDKDDILLNGYLFHFNLFRNDADYVWFGIQDIGYIYDLYYAQPRYDLNKILEEKKPKFVYAVDYENIPYVGRSNTLKKYNMDMMALYQTHPDVKYYLQDMLIDVPEIYVQKFNRELLEKYYRPTEINNLWIRKDDIEK